MKLNFLYQITAASRTPDQGATAPRSPFSLSSTLNWICWTPHPTKFLGTPGYYDLPEYWHFLLEHPVYTALYMHKCSPLSGPQNQHFNYIMNSTAIHKHFWERVVSNHGGSLKPTRGCCTMSQVVYWAIIMFVPARGRKRNHLLQVYVHLNTWRLIKSRRWVILR